MQTATDKREILRKLLEDQGSALIDREQQLKRDQATHKKIWEACEKEYGSFEEKYTKDGSFTESGLKRLRMLFSDGQGNSEIARFFKVTPGAISYHRQKWNMTQRI